MAQGRIAPFTRLWMRWKSLELPWRRRRLIGMDLTGTTYWELKPTAGGAGGMRPRRIAEHPRGRHYADVGQYMSPAWHQWLRHTRPNAPSLEEQRADVQRQADLKQLARLADERWASKPSVLDGPSVQQTGPGMLPRDGGGYVGSKKLDDRERRGGAVAEETQEQAGTKPAARGSEKEEENPWKKAQPKGNPSDEWQPKAWTPASKKK